MHVALKTLFELGFAIPQCAVIVTAGTESSLISYSGFYKSFIDNKRLEILFQTHITDNGRSFSYKFLQQTLDVVNILS